MPLLDVDNPLSAEWAMANALRSRLSECAAAQLLFGSADAAEAVAHVTVGEGEPSRFGEHYELDELEQRNAWAQVVPPDEGGPEWFEDESAEEGAFQLSAPFELWLRWQVSSAVLDAEGENGVSNFFWDACAALPQQLRDATRATETHCPRIRRVQRLGMRWGSRQVNAGQGYYLEAEFALDTGDLSE